MNSTEIDEAWRCGKHPQQSRDFNAKWGRQYWECTTEATKVLHTLMKQIDEGKVAVVSTEATDEVMEAVWGKNYAKYSCGEDGKPAPKEYAPEEYKAAIKAADCELAKILEKQ